MTLRGTNSNQPVINLLFNFLCKRNRKLITVLFSQESKHLNETLLPIGPLGTVVVYSTLWLFTCTQ